MSAVVEFAPQHFGRHTLLDGMAPPHHGYHEAYAPRHGQHSYYPQQEQQQQQAPPPPLPAQGQPLLHQPPRLPSMATMIANATQSHASAALPNSRDTPYTPTLGGRLGYYSDYATPSPVGQTPPQFPGSNSDPHSVSRRPVDVRRSPAQSSTASDRSSDEAAHELRLRQLNALREHHVPGQIPRPYLQHSPRAQGDSLQYDSSLSLSQVSHKVPSAYASSAHSGLRSGPPPPPHSPPSTQPSASPKLEAKSMSISNLLVSDSNSSSSSSKAASKHPMSPAKRPGPSSNTEYRLTVRQQPFAARSCGFGERDRRVIDPPPIVQLSIHDPTFDREQHDRQLRHPFFVVHCSIWDERGVKDMSNMPEDFRQQRRLMGTLVASPFVGLDENNEEGCFFCFPDLSCRTPGTFRLKFVRLDLVNPTKCGEKSDIIATAMSEPFQVYNAKDFPGMQASTALTKRLKEQGCLISIKKGNEKSNGSHGRGGDDSGGDEDEDLEESKSSGRSRKKQRRAAS
ncbi:velvet factor-domain-containing protein [Diplogelasinospora grovesii]|uniref:Velvet factor-domain-containing protein n=1 Tax=Diplogelasinospora grovesii TaxID=303347 RepID=A0AAN6N3F2_9PEZI|nr:velvet factor-domain-containing protein [Diplogelasinospora grovesii]